MAALVKTLSANHSRGFGLGSVCSLGRKRVLVRSHSSVECGVNSTSTISENGVLSSSIVSGAAVDFGFEFDFELDSGFEFDTPLKRQCTGEEQKLSKAFAVCSTEEVQGEDDEKSLLEAMPQEILIKIICGVNHHDLKQLVRVSKSVCDAAIIAKKLHFAYSTPLKIKAFRNSIDFQNPNNQLDDEDYEVPNAPKQSKVPKSRLNRKKLGDISVRLFASPDDDEEQKEQQQPKYRKSLFMDMDTDM